MRAAIERSLAPGISTCFSCHRPWNRITSHVTNYDRGNGCFPLCESCWQALATPEERLPYYRMLWWDWLDASTLAPPRREAFLRDTLEIWPLIEAAVLAGL